LAKGALSALFVLHGILAKPINIAKHNLLAAITGKSCLLNKKANNYLTLQ
jgi:hypothetical protein